MCFSEVKRISLSFLLLIILIGTEACEGKLDESNPSLQKLKIEGITTKVVSKVKVWQAKLTDSKKISKVLLPGTHDAGAYVRGGSLILTQKLTIKQQLEAGVRAFDIRLRAVDKQFLEIYHGIASQGLYFQKDILQTCIDFLKRYPNEFLIFSLKREGAAINSPKGYAGLLRETLAKSEYQKYIYPEFSKELEVGQLRGKILLLHRDFIGEDVAGGYFQGWRDDTSFQGMILTKDSANSAKVFVEDAYKVPTLFHIEEKWSLVKKHLQLSATDNKSENWFVTFTSGTGIFAHPVSVASVINPKLEELLKSEDSDNYRGIVFMDFVKEEDATVAEIISNNF